MPICLFPQAPLGLLPLVLFPYPPGRLRSGLLLLSLALIHSLPERLRSGFLFHPLREPLRLLLLLLFQAPPGRLLTGLLFPLYLVALGGLLPLVELPGFFFSGLLDGGDAV